MRRRIQRSREERPDESGMTLIELIVAMGIFTVVIAVFMAGVVQMSRSTARASAVTDASDQTRKVFQWLDRDVRYASAINYPGAGTSGAYYVEYLLPALEAGTTAQCTQWRYVPGTGELQRRTWADSASPSPSAWQTFATRMRNDLTVTAERPFVFTPVQVPYRNQQLAVYLDLGPGTGAAEREGGELRAHFVARNTDASTVTNADVDNDKQSDTPVCRTGVGRP